jgi:predicted MFS family arabinose efflux permease
MQRIDIDSKATIAALVLLSAIAPAVLLLAPAIVGALVTGSGLTPQAAGLVISAELGAMALVTFSTLWWMRFWNWRTAIRSCLVLMVLGNIASSQSVDSGTALAFWRFVSGLGSGSVIILCMVTIGQTRQRERNYGWWVVGQLVLGAIGLKVLPGLLPHYGLESVYLFLALVSAAMLPLASLLPTAGAAGDRPQGNRRAYWLVSVAGLAAVVLFYISLGGVWAYVERIADRAGMAPQSIGDALTIATLFGIAGSLAATWIGGRWGCLAPLVLGYAMLGGSIALLQSPLSGSTYLLATSVFKFAWTFALPFLLASIAAHDASGRLVVLANFMIGAGLSIGPAAAGATLAAAPDYSGVLTLGIVGSLVSLGFALTLVLGMRRHAVAAVGPA